MIFLRNQDSLKNQIKFDLKNWLQEKHRQCINA